MALKPEKEGELRGMVREVLRDVMAQRGLSAVESVRLGNDTELAAFVARLLDPATQQRLKAGKLRFTLGANSMPAISATPPLTGVITEKHIDRIAASGPIVLAPGAVLTPLARDRARRLGLKIERRL
jgi:hypothetical protein